MSGPLAGGAWAWCGRGHRVAARWVTSCGDCRRAAPSPGPPGERSRPSSSRAAASWAPVPLAGGRCWQGAPGVRSLRLATHRLGGSRCRQRRAACVRVPGPRSHGPGQAPAAEPPPRALSRRSGLQVSQGSAEGSGSVLHLCPLGSSRCPWACGLVSASVVPWPSPPRLCLHAASSSYKVTSHIGGGPALVAPSRPVTSAKTRPCVRPQPRCGLCTGGPVGELRGPPFPPNNA